MGLTHISPYSGSWYPAERSQLLALLNHVFERSATRLESTGYPQQVLAFVVPHAGIQYSGTVASAVYRRLQQLRPRRVILLGFPHRGGPAGLWIPEITSYRTPLGEIRVSDDLRREFLESGAFRSLDEETLCDHSVEIQLPLLQHALDNFELLPVYVSRPAEVTRKKAAEFLQAYLDDPDTVILTSSDFTHFGSAFFYKPFPVDRRTRERLRNLDFTVIDAMSSLEPNLFFDVLEETGATVCGYEPIGLLLETLKLADGTGGKEIFQYALDYETSGDITGDYHHCVSYAALSYFRYRDFLLNPEDQQLLLASARQTLQHYLQTGERKPIPPGKETAGTRLRTGAFVTLRKNGQLRGCIGQREATLPLGQLVPEMTLAAALEDPRFTPVKPGEEGLEIEISILSPFKRVISREKVYPGQHGVYLETASGQAGLLLPQVATEYRWGRDELLRALAVKAGADPGVYDNPKTKLWVFQAQIIEEGS